MEVVLFVAIIFGILYYLRQGHDVEPGNSQDSTYETDPAEELFVKNRQLKLQIEQKRQRDRQEQARSRKYLGPDDFSLTVEETELPAAHFRNIVLPSNGNTPLTEIDEIIVSPTGIFCIEYKAHKGYIFGSRDKKWWTQCRYDGRSRIYNPLHQNYKHTEAIKELLKGDLKAPVHSYVVFTDASKVQVNSKFVFSSNKEMQAAIDRHVKQVYTIDEMKAMLKKLTIADAQSSRLMPDHINQVKRYLELQAW